MCYFDNFEFDEHDVSMTVEDEFEDNPTTIECDFSMCIELCATESAFEEDLNKKIRRLCMMTNCQYRFDSKVKTIFLKLQQDKTFLYLHRMIKTICLLTRLRGNADSFAIVKFYKGNCMYQKVALVYEDFITPGYTIDISKFERFIIEITKNDLI